MYIGVDIGGTNISAGMVSFDGKLLLCKSRPTLPWRGWEVVAKDIICLIKDVIKESGDNVELQGIGVGIPGIGDRKTGNIVECVNLGWKNVPLRQALEKEFCKPIYIDNDASVAALAELENGVFKNTKNSILITLGTGIGGGFIIDGKLYGGSHNVGSEIGHMVIGENFYDCNCGKNGCFETFASATALIKYTRKLIEEADEKTIIQDYIDDLDTLDAKTIIECAKVGDKLALKSVNRLAEYLAIGITNLINVVDPEVIALGGGVSKAGDFLLDLVKNKVKDKVLFKDIDYSKIVIAKYENDAGIIGAAMLCKYN